MSWMMTYFYFKMKLFLPHFDCFYSGYIAGYGVWLAELLVDLNEYIKHFINTLRDIGKIRYKKPLFKPLSNVVDPSLNLFVSLIVFQDLKHLF